MGTSSNELDRKLRKAAGKQHGCFTAAQAIDVGYADSVHLYHVKNGQWIRVFRGVYRLADAPASPAARCMAALLWTRDRNGRVQGVLAPETAERLQTNRLDVDRPVRILVPKGFRRSSEIPDGIEIEIADGKLHKTSKIDGLPAHPSFPSPSNAPPPGLDVPDTYDWLDYQAVRCAPPG